jgi:phosphatidylserine/phosphatidylglycerophosphate/cardiolipin synthase-like enzyme
MMTPIQVHFTPGEDIEPIVVKIIRGARKMIRLQGYGFTSDAIADAIVAAHACGVDVGIVLDGPNEYAKYSKGRQVTEAGITVLYDREHAIAHNKVIIVDGLITVTGSYNWTEGARRKNAENIVVIHDRAIAKAYLSNWHTHAEHSVPPGVGPHPCGITFLDDADEYGDAEPYV